MDIISALNGVNRYNKYFQKLQKSFQMTIDLNKRNIVGLKSKTFRK